MNRPTRLLVLSFLLPALLGACGSAASPTNPPVGSAPQQASDPVSAASTQRSEGGRVTLEATWGGPEAGAVFDIRLDTHSVDLDSLDLANAVLRNDRGERLEAEPWTAPKGGHHREGTLSFGGDAKSFFARATSVELVFTGIGDVPERVLSWQVGS